VELLLGCGEARDKRIFAPGRPKDWTDLRTVDYLEAHKPDVVWNLNDVPWPFEDDTFEEVHAYELLEHLGSLGDDRAFFAHFYEIWRILKPLGNLCATVPGWNDRWAFGDPGHRRVISAESLVFLDQAEYGKQVDDPERRTAMSDYRNLWKGDFIRVGQQSRLDPVTGYTTFIFVLEAQKPAYLNLEQRVRR